MNLPKPTNPEWLYGEDGALPAASSCFRLAESGILPKELLGWMLVTTCLRVLRAIYGSDQATLIGLTEYINDRAKGLTL